MPLCVARSAKLARYPATTGPSGLLIVIPRPSGQRRARSLCVVQSRSRKRRDPFRELHSDGDAGVCSASRKPSSYVGVEVVVVRDVERFSGGAVARRVERDGAGFWRDWGKCCGRGGKRLESRVGGGLAGRLDRSGRCRHLLSSWRQSRRRARAARFAWIGRAPASRLRLVADLSTPRRCASSEPRRARNR